MPHANIWIRVDDWEKWKRIENKSSFIHNALLADKHLHELDPKETRYNYDPDKYPNDMPKNPKLCQHGHSKGDCTMKPSACKFSRYN